MPRNLAPSNGVSCYSILVWDFWTSGSSSWPKVMDKQWLHRCSQRALNFLYVHSATQSAQALKHRYHISDLGFPVKNLSVRNPRHHFAVHLPPLACLNGVCLCSLYRDKIIETADIKHVFWIIYVFSKGLKKKKKEEQKYQAYLPIYAAEMEKIWEQIVQNHGLHSVRKILVTSYMGMWVFCGLSKHHHMLQVKKKIKPCACVEIQISVSFCHF